MSDPTGPQTPARPSGDPDPTADLTGGEGGGLRRTGRRGLSRRRDDDAIPVAPDDSSPAADGSGTAAADDSGPVADGSGTAAADDSGPVAPNPGALLADGVTSTARKGNPVAWTSLLVATVLTIWQAAYALSVQDAEAAGREVYASVSLFVSLVLGLSAAVLGIVGIAQRRHPRWPALAGLAVGLHVFLVSVFAWIGGLMDEGV